MKIHNFPYLPKGIQREEKPGFEVWNTALDRYDGVETPTAPVTQPALNPIVTPPAPAQPQFASPPNPIPFQPSIPVPAADNNNTIVLPENEIQEIESRIKQSNPHSTPEDITRLIAAEKETRIKDYKETQELSNQIRSKLELVNADPSAKSLSDEKKLEMARDLVDRDLSNKNIFGNIITSKTELESKSNLDYTSIAKNIIIEGSPVEIKENTIDALQESINSRIEEIKQGHGEYTNLDEDEKRLVHFAAREGIDKLEKFLYPDRNLINIIQLDDETKMRMYLREEEQKLGNEPTEEEINELLQDMKENKLQNGKSEYDETIRAIDKSLKSKLAEARNEVIRRSERNEARIRERDQQSYQKLASQVTQAIDKLNIYAGQTVPNEIKTYLKGYLNEANLKKVQTSPEILANALLMHNFGEALLKGLQELYYQKGRAKGLQVSRNIPEMEPVNRVGGSASASSADKKGGFSSWENGLNNQKRT